MAAYPTLPQTEGTKLVPRPGLMKRVATNGVARTRALSSATRYDPVIQHKGLTLAQFQALQTFYETNRAIPFTIVYNPEGITLTCLFDERGFDYTPQPGAAAAALFDVTVYLLQQN